ncbi:hypothetical protein PTTG_30169 [Puccinia triticina 1-1 BBBD Race 1]|uniref:Uncharacterized protein n=1 Tax=Puccinia triticina (isolate 1-1 / race 1 (BBBD)) TaxID=630390 RepID=A0A180FZV2_PUCT1|nr:hypothetical protein PTTG_30169 [Puccinia triticina 1-1 BBBD Race 1]
MAMNVGSGTVVTNYAGPGPLLNTSKHRYAWMLFAQSSKFATPANLSAAGTAPGHWYESERTIEEKLSSASQKIEDHIEERLSPITQATNPFSLLTNWPQPIFVQLELFDNQTVLFQLILAIQRPTQPIPQSNGQHNQFRNPTAHTTNSSGQLGAMPTGASTSTQAAAKSDANGPLWNDCAATIKNVVMGLGFAVSGYILIQ